MTRLSCICALLLAGCAGPTATPPPEPIELRLATVPYLSRLAQELTGSFSRQHPYVTFELSVMAARDALDAVAGRQVDVALVAEPVEAGRDSLEATPVGRQAVVLAVHPSNPVDGLTWAQVRDIFSGQVWDWAVVDRRWPAQEILVVSQHAGAVSRLAFDRQVMADARITPRAVVATGDEVAGQIIAEEPAAIGYLLAGMADGAVKVLSIDGITPTSSAEPPAEWPITRPINLVTHIDANVYVLDFIDFNQKD